MMDNVVEAEKKANHVLHTLLSVEMAEKNGIVIDGKCILPTVSFPLIQTAPSTPVACTNPALLTVDSKQQDEWATTSVSIENHPVYSNVDSNSFSQYEVQDQQVIWNENTIASNEDSVEHDIFTPTTNKTHDLRNTVEDGKDANTSTVNSTNVIQNRANSMRSQDKKRKKSSSYYNTSATKLEEHAVQVKDRFKRGCECQDESCFRGLNADTVYRHRLNIAELTKSEHDMYLMGVTMACLANPDTTVRHKERRRLRAQYVYQGRRVCLDAFLYLENCTHYQLKRIRKHVMTHGVAPRIHGNHGKKPHNVFPLNIYYHATEFLKQYLEQFTDDNESVNNNLTRPTIQLPWDITRKNLHEAYKQFGQILEPGTKLMGYSTFRHFMKEQFSNVKFCKVDTNIRIAGSDIHNDNNIMLQHSRVRQHQIDQQLPVCVDNNGIQKIEISQQTIPTSKSLKAERSINTGINQSVQKCIISNEVRQVIPLVVAQSNNTSGVTHSQTAFLVTPVSQLLPNTEQNSPVSNTTANTYSYQLSNTGYVLNEQCNLVTALSNGQVQHTPYTFSTI